MPFTPVPFSEPNGAAPAPANPPDLTGAYKVVKYTYDAFDQRIAQMVYSDYDGTLSIPDDFFQGEYYYVRDNQERIVFDDLGDVQAVRLYGAAVDQLLAEQVARTSGADQMTLWPIADRLGTIRAFGISDFPSDTEIRTAEHYKYDAWGNIIAESKVQLPNRITSLAFTGRVFDQTVGIQYNRARYYDPLAKRWISEDPLGFAGGDANLYRYVNNSPTNATDPSGRLVTGGVATVGCTIVGGVTGFFAAGYSADDGWSWSRAWAGAGSGAMVGLGVGLAIDTLGGSSVISTALIGAGLGSALGGGLLSGGQDTDWAGWGVGGLVGGAVGAAIAVAPGLIVAGAEASGTSIATYLATQAGVSVVETDIEWAATQAFGTKQDIENFSYLGTFAKNFAINSLTGGIGGKAKTGSRVARYLAQTGSFLGRQGIEIGIETSYDVGVRGQDFNQSLIVNTVGSLGGEALSGAIGYGLKRTYTSLFGQFSILADNAPMSIAHAMARGDINYNVVSPAIGDFDKSFFTLGTMQKVNRAFAEIENVFGKTYARKIRNLLDSVPNKFERQIDDFGEFIVRRSPKSPVIKLANNFGNAKILAATILHEVRHLRQYNKLGRTRFLDQGVIRAEMFATAPNIVQGKRLGLSTEDLQYFIDYYKRWRQ